MRLLIAGGTVVDGTGRPRQRADLLVERGRIAEIGFFDAPADARRLDAGGLLVAPGFIDIHSHSDFTLLLDPRAVSSITQGVTLEVVGNCGHGCAPIADPELARANIYGASGGQPISWRTMAEYLDRLESARPAVNVVSLAPNGNLRLAAAGAVDRPSTLEELATMTRLLEQALEEGAFGFSTGLEYGPERDCSEEEIVALCRVVARSGGLYATHTRNRAGEPDEAVAEAIRTAADAGARLQISHISVVARLTEDGRGAVEDAARRGIDVGFDMHTRLFGTTNLSAALPPWALEGAPGAVADRLRDPRTRRELRAYPSIVTSLARGDWSRVVLFGCRARPEFSGRSIAEIAASAGAGPLDAVYDLLLEEIHDLHAPTIIAFTYREEDVRQAFEHPGCMVGSDATALAPDGPLADRSFHGAYTWAAWFFRRFVRETGTLSIEEAVRRLTSLPASRLGLEDRGVLRRGARADIAVLDPGRFGERGTTFEPNQIAEGMVHTLVNGRLALRDGIVTGDRAGEVLRRTACSRLRK